MTRRRLRRTATAGAPSETRHRTRQRPAPCRADTSPPRRRHAARQLVCSAWHWISSPCPRARRSRRNSRRPAARAAGRRLAMDRRRSRRVATSTADAVALAHTETAPSRTPGTPRRAPPPRLSGHAARGAGRRRRRSRLGGRWARGPRAARARRGAFRATERAAFSTAGARDRGAGPARGRPR